MTVAAARCFPAKHNTNQPNTIAFDRGNKIESRCINIACFDTICAAIFCQQLVMIAVFPAFPVKALGAEIFIKLGKFWIRGVGSEMLGRGARRRILFVTENKKNEFLCKNEKKSFFALAFF